MSGNGAVRWRAKSRILIVGCGDVGLRLATRLVDRFDVTGTARSDEQLAAIRRTGARAMRLDLDSPVPLALAGIAPWVVHLAPPQTGGEFDRRTRHLVASLRGIARLVYVSTSGVYGNHAGAWVDETGKCTPDSARGRRRLDAERVLRDFARRSRVRLSILRVPGIYAQDRLPRQRLLDRLPALNRDEDVFTNHIHADDLARALEAALFFGRPLRTYNASDDSALQMGDYFDRVADALALPRPPRLSLERLRDALTPMQMSFMQESRRLMNRRLKRELGVRLEYATVDATLATLKQRPA